MAHCCSSLYWRHCPGVSEEACPWSYCMQMIWFYWQSLLLEKIKKWRVGMEEKGLRVNVGKTKVMRCQEDAGQAVKTGRYLCGVCGRGVGSNSIKCTSCDTWVHKKMQLHCRQTHACRWISLHTVHDDSPASLKMSRQILEVKIGAGKWPES